MEHNETFWQAVVRRDRSFDGRFFFGVVTTGVYCKPSCPARRPLARNVRFYASPDLAERDGLRPCLRCCPRSEGGRLDRRIRSLCAYIAEHATDGVRLEQLSAVAGWSETHLQKAFQAAIGMSPKQYLDACRMQLLKKSLRGGRSVTDALYEAGYGSSSRMYERSSQLGMTPSEYRNGAPAQTIAFEIAQTGLGLLLMAATGRGLCKVAFGDSEHALLDELRNEFPAAALSAPQGEVREWFRAVAGFIDTGKCVLGNVPEDIRGTAFQQMVWRRLRSIPPGSTRTYAEVAKAIGRPGAARAVGRACALNPLAVLTPCHRVVPAKGGTGAYRWGRERKRQILNRESL